MQIFAKVSSCAAHQGYPNYLGSRAKIGALNWPKEPKLEFVKEPVKEPIIVQLIDYRV